MLFRSCRDAGLACGRGVVVDDYLHTSDPAISAVGECVEHRGQVFGLVAPLWDMAKVLADRLSGTGDKPFVPAVTGTRLKVTGIDMFSAGEIEADDTADAIVFRDPSRGAHRKLVVRDEKLVGAVLYGDARDGFWYHDLIRTGADVSAIRDRLAFGPGA